MLILTASEAAKIFGVTTDTLRRWGDDPNHPLKTYRPGVHRLYTIKSIVDILVDNHAEIPLIIYQKYLDDFINSDDFMRAVIDATIASWSRSTTMIEIFPDGHYRLLDANSIGNRYESPGVILRIPVISSSDVDSADDEMTYLLMEAFWSEEEEIVKNIRRSLAEKFLFGGQS